MAQVEMPFGEAFRSNDASPISAPHYPQEASVELLPNPDFVFPMRQPTAGGDASNSASAGSSRPMSMHTFPRSQHGLAERGQRRTRSTLPNFTFNPADASNPSTRSSTPPHSPLSTSPTTPSRPMGHHRRGGSEFIGDSKKDGTATLLSSSPTKSDMPIPLEGATRLGPLAGRRGHAHRRSAAISSHDLSSILQPKDASAAPRADSAPTTPMEIDTNASPQHVAQRSTSFPSPSRSASVDESALFQRDMDSSPRRPSSRARVGFSERVEYIRPLSTISSETESSMSTARGQHSATGSLSSMVSLGAASPPSARTMRPSLDATPKHSNPETRPGTAGAIMDSSPERQVFGSELDALRRPVSAHSPTTGLRSGSPSAAAARKNRPFWPEHRHQAAKPAHALHSSVSEPSLPQALKNSPPPSPTEPHLHPYKDEDDTQSDGRKSRKPRKIRSWATSLVSRKTKSRSPVSSRSTSGSSDAAATTSDASETAAEPSMPADLDLDAAFDADNTVTLLSPKESEIPIPKAPAAPLDPSNRPPTAPELESRGGIIDLDAAFGFSTQDFAPGSPSRRSGMRGGVRKTLHSGSFSGGPSGMSLSKHKRAESAPELVPFYHRSAAMASTSTMENVFEEDEEDAEGEADRKANSGCEDTKLIAEEEQLPSIGIQVVEADSPDNAAEISWNFDNGLGIRQKRAELQRTPASDGPSPKGTSAAEAGYFAQRNRSQSPQQDERSPVEIVEDHEEPRASSLTRSSDSTITPPLPPVDVKEHQPEMNLSLPVPQHALMTPDTVTSSAFSSPQFSCGRSSFETPRLGTAASSITDNRTINSLALGEPGPDFRVSVDDVPSLTSSRSTMTSGQQHHLPHFAPRAPGDRSVSVSSASQGIPESRRKRASIASLSKLISSSFNEKSKLSIEQRPQSEHLEPPKELKTKRSKRFSKLVNFWKTNKDQA